MNINITINNVYLNALSIIAIIIKVYFQFSIISKWIAYIYNIC